MADSNSPLRPNGPDTQASYYNLLVQGFSEGHLYVKRDPPAALARLANPYDPAAHGPYTPTTLDLSYYRGKLYLYFGVMPALVLFWPFHALTGSFLSERCAVAVLFAIGFAVALGLMRSMCRRYFPEMNIWTLTGYALALGLALGLTISGDLYGFKDWRISGNVYQVAIIFGFAFTMLALAAIWRAMHADPKRQAPWLVLAGIAYGLAVGSRPTLLFGAVILFIPCLRAWREAAGPGSRWRAVRLFAAGAGPVTLVGLGLMLYNALRFRDPFEFGCRYQLNGFYNPMTTHLFSLHYFWFNLRIYFFHSLDWSRFPNLITAPIAPLPDGYHPGCATAGAGILWRYPLVWLALAAPLAWKGTGEKASSLRWFALALTSYITISLGVLFLFFSVYERYELDFLPELMLLSFIGFLGLKRVAAPLRPGTFFVRWSWRLLLSYSALSGALFAVLSNIEAHASVDCLAGNRFFNQNNFDEAIGLYQNAEALWPDYGEPHCGLGNILAQEGHPQAAIAEFQKAIELSPDLVEAHNNLGHCLLHTGRLDEAIAQFELAVQMRPRSVNYRNALGAAYAKKGMWDAAIAQFEKAIEIEPDLAEAHNDLGYCFLQTGRIDAAIGEHRTALTLEPGSATYLGALANALCQKGSFEEAALEYQKALKLSPNDAEACNNLGYCLQQMGRLDEAIAEYRKAIKFQPGMAGAYFNLGNVFRDKKMAAEAIGSYEKAIALEPQFVAAQLNLAWMLATWPDAAVRNGDKAVALAKGLRDLSQGKDPKILRALAAAYAETGKFAQAVATAKQALAQAQSQADLSADLQTEIRLYQSNSPCRSTGNF